MYTLILMRGSLFGGLGVVVVSSTAVISGDKQTTPAASLLVQSLAPQPSKRHAVKFFSSPVQYKLSIQKRPALSAQPRLLEH
jgi:hypothetical protein